MAFQFPDPFVTPEFTGANGVTYQWDTADEKWVIKGFQVDFDDRYVNKTGSGQRYYGIDAGYSDAPGHNTYRYDYINSSSSHTSTIRSWGPDWLLQGLLVSFKTATGGTGTTNSSVTLYNLKFGNLYSTHSGSSYRALPLNLRPYSGRNKHADSTNKFVGF